MDIPQTGYAVMARRLPPPNVAAGIQEAGWRAMQGQAGGQAGGQRRGQRGQRGHAHRPSDPVVVQEAKGPGGQAGVPARR